MIAGTSQRSMTPTAARARHAREQAGLSLAQAQRRVGRSATDVEIGVEVGRDDLRELANTYGVSLAWLADGISTPIAASTVQLLADADIKDSDRDGVLELLATLPAGGRR